MRFCIDLTTSGEQDLCISAWVSPLLGSRIYAFLDWSRHFWVAGSMHCYIGLATSGEEDLCICALVSPLLLSARERELRKC
jgi:hypothetical protein